MNYALQIILIALTIGGLISWVSWRKTHYRVQIDQNTIIVGTNAEYPPFTFRENGEIVGFDIDIAKEVMARLGKKMELKDMSFSMLLPKLQLGTLHMVAAGISPSPEREGQVFFTKPYLRNDPLVIITRADQPTLTSITDLTGKQVVVNDGFTADLYLSEFKGPIIKRLPTVSDAFLALSSKRIDAFVSARTAVEPFFKQADRTKFNIAVLPEKSDSYALMISRKQPELLIQVQHALDAMEQDNTITTIKQKWGLP